MAIKKKKKYIEHSLPIVTGIIDAFTLLPGAATIAGLYKITSAIKEDFEKKKLDAFLKQTETISNKQRQDFLSSLDKDQESFIKKTLLQLDRMDEEHKAELMGKMLKATILKKISVEDFQRISTSIERVYHEDIRFLYIYFTLIRPHPSYPKVTNPPMEIVSEYKAMEKKLFIWSRLKNLSLNGLVDEYTGNIYDKTSVSTDYRLNKSGDLLIKYGFGF